MASRPSLWERLQKRLAKYHLGVTLQLLGVIAAAGIVALVYTFLRRRYVWLPQFSPTDVLAVLAISFAIVQFMDAKRQEREITAIEGAVSTRFVGLFPKNLRHIQEVISKANRYVYVMVDFIGYGQYSAPEEHQKYVAALQSVIRKDLDVRLICYNAKLGQDERKLQFPDDPAPFEGIRNKKVFETFCARNKISPLPETNAALREVLERRDASVRPSVSNIKYLDESAAFFVWLEDDEDAVFTFKNVGNRELGLSFRTQDANLIRQFKEVFNEAWTTASLNYGGSDASTQNAQSKPDLSNLSGGMSPKKA
ncbi:MAG TPA: hypothetical protein VN822_03910 [Candidatus Acidoferrales bacterium]|nr:hypothetical protein [Candidatus Acidoferrales bacterium]